MSNWTVDHAIRRLSQPGAMLNGTTRRSAAAAARAALSGHRPPTTDPIETLAASIVIDPTTIDWPTVLDALHPAEAVEIVGVATQLVAADTITTAQGLEPVALAPPHEGKPTDPIEPGAERSWAPVPTVDPPADTVYPPAPLVPKVYQALSMVPAEARALIDLSDTMYIPLADLFSPSAVRPDATLSRLQTELVAARVSVLNRCFYCTMAHSALLEAAGQTAACDIDLAAVAATSGSGVPHGDTMVAFVDAAIGREDPAGARRDLDEALDSGAVREAAGTIGAFAALNRVADALQVPFDRGWDDVVVQIVGKIDPAAQFESARFTPRS